MAVLLVRISSSTTFYIPLNEFDADDRLFDRATTTYHTFEGRDKQVTREGTSGEQHLCTSVEDVVRKTLVPRGMDKLIHDDKGNTTISNEGATIMKLLDITPATKILFDIAKSQDSEVVYGTNTIVLLAGEFLKEAKPFIDDGVHQQILFKVTGLQAISGWYILIVIPSLVGSGLHFDFQQAIEKIK